MESHRRAPLRRLGRGIAEPYSHADAVCMSWRDRDWETSPSSRPPPLSNSRRSLIWGLLSALAIAVLAFAFVERPSSAPSFSPSPSAPRAAVVYSGATAQGKNNPSERLACTSEAANIRVGVWVCVAWTVLQPGQFAAPAVDPGGQCGVRHVDQATARWVCDRATPPDPDSLPTPLGAPRVQPTSPV